MRSHSVEKVVRVNRPAILLCHFLIQGHLQRLTEQNSSSCPSQITTKHLTSIQHFVPSLLCSAAIEAGSGRKETAQKGRKASGKGHNGRGKITGQGRWTEDEAERSMKQGWNREKDGERDE